MAPPPQCLKRGEREGGDGEGDANGVCAHEARGGPLPARRRAYSGAASAPRSLSPFEASLAARLRASPRANFALAPTSPPPFTLAQIRAAVPAHCFERSALTSLAYAGRDMVGLIVLAYLATRIHTAAPAACGIAAERGLLSASTQPLCTPALAALLWPLYWAAAGCVGTGWWMIGHECGHGAFSTSPALNYIVGMVSHCSLLVPFSAWAMTHARHHGNTNSIEHDEPFVPASRASFLQRETIGSLIESSTFSFVSLLLMLVGGWPAYLLADLGGPSKNSVAGKTQDHFLPSSSLFGPKHFWPVVASTCGVGVTLCLLALACARFGCLAVSAVYLVPLLIVNGHLVTITFLQHTHLGVPHYSDGAHSWLRGALCTVDRSWGPLRDALFHHISDTHVVHHLFHEMPFYHAVEATAVVRAVLGEYYLNDSAPIGEALWTTFNSCKFSEEDTPGSGVHWMHDTAEAKRGLAREAAAKQQ